MLNLYNNKEHREFLRHQWQPKWYISGTTTEFADRIGYYENKY